jgi:hypothetical protein
MGWRYLLFTLGALTMGMFFLRFVVFRFQESPKFLVYQGRDIDAIKILERIARVNGTQCTLSLDDLTIHDGQNDQVTNGEKPAVLDRAKKELSRLGVLFSTWQHTRVTILVWVTYMCDFWGFTLAGK